MRFCHLFTAALVFAGTSAASAQETVDITVPSFVTFQVTDVSLTSTDLSTTVRFANAVLEAGRVLRISVIADTTAFSGPRGSIAASSVSWTVSNAQGGFGSNGTVSASTYTEVFRSQIDTASGGVDLRWTLGPPGTDVLASTYDLALRWKIESIAP